MKPGDLRRFKPKSYAPDEPNIGGRSFMIVEVNERPYNVYVNLLMNDRVLEEWSYRWVEKNSEVVSAAG